MSLIVSSASFYLLPRYLQMLLIATIYFAPTNNSSWCSIRSTQKTISSVP
ncbi:unnamed protein product [Arabidopsis lyrata]|uniref:Predicted protein n=1 Tax=Arabidopsis lyrata subsp. lyrata TaxID=81972 RepID=D7LZ47_ARALL|nr:predicted protein [Arabidopsis lyrata subsp. lyrata]CAH8270222.1 unnamed protein product [Arabidopsis lyrata]